MSYRWKPNAIQRAAFKEKMQDPDEKKAYEDRKFRKNTYNDSSESFKNRSFIPTEFQYKFALNLIGNKSCEVETACNMVQSGYICQDKIHHKYIHIINAIQRGEKTQLDTKFD